MKRLIFVLLVCSSFSLAAEEHEFRELHAITPKGTDVLASAGFDVFAFRLPIAETNGCAISLRLKHGKKDREVEICCRLSHDQLESQSGVDVIVTIQETRTFFGGRKLKVGYLVAGCSGSVVVSASDMPFVYDGDVMLDPEDKILLAGSYRTALPEVNAQRTALYLVASPWKGQRANQLSQATDAALALIGDH